MFLAFTTALSLFIFFFFNDTATTEIYTLSLHDALPISVGQEDGELPRAAPAIPRHVAARGHIRQEVHERAGIDRTMCRIRRGALREVVDRKSTRLNSSHLVISYAVFCLKKKKTNNNT